MDADQEQLCLDKLQAAIESLVSVLSSNDETLRQSVRWSLVNIGEDCIPALSDLLSHGNRHARWEAAKTLGEIGTPAAASALVNGLDDEVFDIRWLAANGLIALGISGLAPMLLALIDNPESPHLRESAHHVVRVLSESDLRDMLNPLRLALADSRSDATASAAAVLDELAFDTENE